MELETFEDRFEYLKLGGGVCEDTFGGDRYLNQIFYRSKEWRDFRYKIIVRDNGCDLAHPDRPIPGMILIHHLNPITRDDIINRSPCLFDENNVVCVSKDTHNAIHYGSLQSANNYSFTERSQNDTSPWLKGVT